MKSELIPFYKPELPPLEQYVSLLQEIWESRMVSNFSAFARRMETDAAKYLGAPYVRAVVSCDIGLIIVLKALELPAGAPCFVSDFTFNSTINAALWAGLKPVLIDIDPDTYNISSEALLHAMQKQDQRGVVLATHVFGNPCNVQQLHSIARSNDSFLIFDAAHALGSKIQDTLVGNFGDAEVFSLSGTKIVTSAEGGLISTPHQWLAEKVTYLRAYGFQHDYYSKYVGLNGKISELHSALAILSLNQLEKSVMRRLEVVQTYKDFLGDQVGWQKIDPENRSTYKDVSISLGNVREAVEKTLSERQIQTKRYFVPLHFMKPYQEFCYGDYPVAEQIYESTLCIPAYADLRIDDQERISKIILQTLIP